ncbi:hypothetical protein C0995_002856 [Termitomyces sp. Mi166|nr:hypothetical protein C0995_002856 [Termitomyces sp. Mi166\
MDNHSFEQIKLSLERPYKDDNGDRIPVLFDITPEGQQIYEKKENSIKALGNNLRRIFIERGVDFFDKTKGHELEGRLLADDVDTSDTSDTTESPELGTRAMNVEELVKMRSEIIPQLFTSLGEITLARDLLASLLSSSFPQPENSTTNLSATVVTKPPPIVSVQAFNGQLTIGSKDEALRKAANVFKSAAYSMDRGRIKGEKYWVDALKVRRANWGLNPAPLPFGSATGKGADKTSKDFLISYGLEESPAAFRRQAVARMASDEAFTHGLVFFHRQHTRLRISVSVVGVDGLCITSQNTLARVDEKGPEVALKGAQQEIVEQEIFSLLVQEAGNLPTASARVSERLIVIDAAHGTELKFELAQRLGSMGVGGVAKDNLHPPPILQPVIDLLQYQVFCERIKSEIDQMVAALSVAGIKSSLRFNPVGETGRQLVQLIENGGNVIGGEAVLRIDDRYVSSLCTINCSSSIYSEAYDPFDLPIPIVINCASSTSDLDNILYPSTMSIVNR